MGWWLRKQFLRLKLYASENLANEAESLIIWYAVCFALGAAFYFAYPVEIPVWVCVVWFEMLLLLLWFSRHENNRFKVLTYVLVFILGLSVAKADALYRKKNLEENMPEISYISGIIKDRDYNSNNRLRLLLTDADDYDKDYKGDFRISLLQSAPELIPGTCVELIAKFPSEMTPNPLSNYDFKRAMFYKGISAVGYALTPVYTKPCQTKTGTLKTGISTIREKIKTMAEKYADKQVAAVIKALSVGDKSGISEAQASQYRTAGLAHFLAISGMHMGMIALLLFFLIRVLLLPVGAGRYDLRKPAAVASLALTFGYFLISGQSVSCIRAFVMTSLVLLGILLNRRAISLRLWAFAVLVVTVITPEAVVSPGFLMSFAAVLGLVSYYESHTAQVQGFFTPKQWWKMVTAYISGLLITDFVASLMTLPYSLYYFHQISVYTTLGNLLAGPVIAFWVMPALLLFLITLPFGGAWSVKPLAAGIETINHIAAWVSYLPGADSGAHFGIVPAWSIFLLTLGLLWLCIWQSEWRIWGLTGIILGLIGVILAPRPDFVFDESGTTYAYRTESGILSPSCLAKNRFLTRVWTGENRSRGCMDDKTMVCAKENETETCLYQNRIAFSTGKLSLDGKEIPLHRGGFIMLKNTGADIRYLPPLSNRLWNN